MKSSLVIGIMALQGDVQEHMKAMNSTIEEMLRHNENNLKNIHTKQIKLPDDLLSIDGIILPGGESTAMAIIGEKWGLFPALRKWVSEKRPVCHLNFYSCNLNIIFFNHIKINRSRYGVPVLE